MASSFQNLACLLSCLYNVSVHLRQTQKQNTRSRTGRVARVPAFVSHSRVLPTANHVSVTDMPCALLSSNHCIRGHRSTKCNHVTRPMIPVKKPGRPLSTCAARGKGCQCMKVTIAIPKKSKCGCGVPESKTNGKGSPVMSMPSTTETFTSPTRTASFRVQKSTVPMPYDISHLMMMNPNTLDALAGNGLSLGMDGNLGQGGLIPSPGFVPNYQTSLDNSAGPLGPLPIPPPGFVPPMNYANAVPLHNHDMALQIPTVDGTVGYTSTTQHFGLPTVSQDSFPYGNRLDEPLQYDQWKQLTSTPSHGGTSRGAYPTTQSVMETNGRSATASGSYMTAECLCGPGCQCEGCIAHPFNSATQEYAFSALVDQQLSLSDDGSSNDNGNGNGNCCQRQHSRASSLSDGNNNGTHLASNGIKAGDFTSPLADASATEDASPISGTGSLDTTQTGTSEIPASDYLWVQYAGLCSGDSNSCPCGDDCACVDCMIHGAANSHLQSAFGSSGDAWDDGGASTTS